MKKKITLLSLFTLIFSVGLMANGSSKIDAADINGQITYQAQVQKQGWQKYVKNGQIAGTTGLALRLEGLKIKLVDVKGSVEYSAHVQHSGWQNFVKDNELAGTAGKSLRLEAMKIRLTGDAAAKYDVHYRAHLQNSGWQSWKKNGEVAGTTGLALRLEAIEIKLIAKTSTQPPIPESDMAKVVKIAHEQVGIPYASAGTTRAGFDCSGLTQYVYRQARGMNIGRITTDQEKAGTIIALNDAKPGDLVFWGKRGATYHVGIYIGNGNYIHAPVPGEKVKIQSIKWYKPDFALRVK